MLKFCHSSFFFSPQSVSVVQCTAIFQSRNITERHGDHNHFLSFEEKTRPNLFRGSSPAFIPNQQPTFPQLVLSVKSLSLNFCSPSPVCKLVSANSLHHHSCALVYVYIYTSTKDPLLDMYAFFYAFLHQCFVTNVLIYKPSLFCNVPMLYWRKYTF